jgi:hypothetical protein
MGIYFNMLRESAIQDPDEVGIDLDAVEDAVAGDNGIASHEEEIEDAVAGVIDDPIEEATHIMYESEYNFNQIMRTIGITELNEACSGRDFFLEGGDAKGFFESIKANIVKMFEKITKVFHDVIRKIQHACDMHKKYYEKNKSNIEKGYDGKWAVDKAFDMEMLSIDDGNRGAAFFNKKAKETPPLLTLGEMEIKRVKTSNDTSYTADPSWARQDSIINRVIGKDLGDVKALKTFLYEETFKKRSYGSDKNNGKLKETVINALKSRDDIDALSDAYAELKKQYKKYLGEIARYSKSVNAPEDRKFGNRVAVTQVTMHYMKAIQFERGIYNIIFSNSMKALKLRRNQAFVFAMAWVKAAKNKKNDKKDGETSPKSESSVFHNIDII